MNAFSDSPVAMLVLEGYAVPVIKNRNLFYLFDSHAKIVLDCHCHIYNQSQHATKGSTQFSMKIPIFSFS